MVKKNAKTDKAIVDETTIDVQNVQEGTASVDSAQPTPGTEVGESESTEKELPVSSGQDNGEEANGAENPELDTESEAAAAGEKGNDADDPLTNGDPVYTESKETTEKRNRIAADVFAKNVQCQALYFTTDLIPFFSQSDAFRHGSISLKNETVVTINRK